MRHLVLFSNNYERSRGGVAQSIERPKGPSPLQLYWHGFESRPRRLARVLELSVRIGSVEKNNYERNPRLISRFRNSKSKATFYQDLVYDLVDL